jgi:two-component system chemotaxis response regulator CheB
MSGKIGVLIIDDSAITRSVIARELAKAGDIEVVATAADPLTARDLILEKRPDVITLDLELPRMDGLTFLRRVLKYSPVPAIVCSSLTPAGCSKAMECLEAGACDVIGKPKSGNTAEWGAQLVELVRGAARARVGRRPIEPLPPPIAKPVAATTTPPPVTGVDSRKIIAIGSSTGGTEALRTVLAALPYETPAILMTQHMPEGFTKPFSERLNGLSRMDVREATDGEPVRPGLALLAPAGRHLRLSRENGRYVARLSDGPAVKRHRPSVEVLFESVAQAAGAHAMGVILTGMGDDGADGLLSMHRAGALTVAQDETSCVVFGMPKAAIAKGGVRVICPLEDVAARIRDFTSGALSHAA